MKKFMMLMVMALGIVMMGCGDEGGPVGIHSESASVAARVEGTSSPAAPAKGVQLPTNSAILLHGVKGHDGLGAYVILEELTVPGEAGLIRLDLTPANLRIGGKGLWDTIGREATVELQPIKMWEGEGNSLIGVRNARLRLDVPGQTSRGEYPAPRSTVAIAATPAIAESEIHDPSEVLGTYRKDPNSMDSFITFQLDVAPLAQADKFRIIYREGDSVKKQEPVMWNRLNTIKLKGDYYFREVEINGRYYLEPVVLVRDLRSW